MTRGLLPAAALAAAALLACESATPHVSAVDEVDRGVTEGVALRIFATGETRGFLGPCGCEEKQHGGVPRRATYLRGVTGGDDFRIDLGNAAAGRGALRDLRLDATFDSLVRMGYDAMVPGLLEVELGAAFDAAAAAHPELRLVCANLVDEAGQPVFPAAIVRELSDGRQIGIVGVTDDTAQPSGGRRVQPAVGAAQRAAAALTDVDAIIVVAAMPRTRAAAVAAAVPEASLVLASSAADDASAMMAPAKTDPADEDFQSTAPPLATVGDFASYVRRVDFDEELRATRTWRAWLGEELADDPELAGLLKQFRQDAIALDPNLVADIWKGLDAAGFAGSDACVACHDEDHEVWLASAHGHAMRILVERDANRDPECVPCHLVDVPPDGVRDMPLADELGVGCEGCHGGRAQHIEDARDGNLPDEPPYDGARDGCEGCHRPPEVTRFDFDELWPIILHGE